MNQPRVTTEMLNQAARVLNTTDRNVVIGAVLQALISQGVDVKAAIEAVFGEGSFDSMCGQVYDLLRAQAATRH